MPAYLQLVSARGGTQLQGWNAGKEWKGWIPIQSYSLETRRPIVARTGGQAANPQNTADIHQIHLVAKMADIDVSTLMRWSTEGESATAKLDVLPSAGQGDEGRQYLMTDAYVANVSIAGDIIAFSLDFQKFESRYLLRL